MLVLTSRPASGRKVYIFMEEHGYWDENSKRYVYEVSKLSTEDELNYEQALALYNEAKQNLALRGFVHGFVRDGSRKGPNEYRLFEPKPVTI